MAKKSVRIVFVIVLIAIVSMLVSACSSQVTAAPVSKIGVMFSGRIGSCSMDEQQVMLNAVPENAMMTVDQWLDGQAAGHACILALVNR